VGLWLDLCVGGRCSIHRLVVGGHCIARFDQLSQFPRFHGSFGTPSRRQNSRRTWTLSASVEPTRSTPVRSPGVTRSSLLAPNQLQPSFDTPSRLVDAITSVLQPAVSRAELERSPADLCSFSAASWIAQYWNLSLYGCSHAPGSGKFRRVVSDGLAVPILGLPPWDGVSSAPSKFSKSRSLTPAFLSRAKSGPPGGCCVCTCATQ
jgi:hypothetical protein